MSCLIIQIWTVTFPMIRDHSSHLVIGLKGWTHVVMVLYILCQKIRFAQVNGNCEVFKMQVLYMNT